MGSLQNLWWSGQRPGRQQGGFSLTELMIVIAIIGILSAIAIPAMMSSYPDYLLKEAARDMLSNFQKAKLEAVKRNAWVTVTFNQAVAGTTFDYVIFVDSNQDHRFTAGETVLVQQNFARYGGGVRLLTPAEAGVLNVPDFGANTLNADNLPCFTYTPRGLPRDNSNLGASGTVWLTNRKGPLVTRRNVVLNAMGSLTITR